VFGLEVRRATRDSDFAVAVKDWTEFHAIKAHLVNDAQFIHDEAKIHRLFKNGYPVDIIPFRGVESPEGTIAWPRDLSMVMTVVGYEDALAAAENVQIEPELVMRVVSLAGLVVLKLFAWEDRGHQDSRDAEDFATVLRSYAAAGNEDRLYGDSMDTMEAADFDIELAGARLLGRDTRCIARDDTRRRLAELLGDFRRRERLVTHMSKGQATFENAILAAEVLVKQFEAGLRGT
jgi:predicted nucleotidyltransferase